MPSAPRATVDRHSRYDHALAEVDEWIFAADHTARRLTPDEIRRYRRRKFSDGWRTEIHFADKARTLDILVNKSFPREIPRIALVQPPPFLSWPHVERDGVLCLFPDTTLADLSNPRNVTINALAEASQLIEEIVAGKRESDFREEFLSYWSAAVDDNAPRTISLCEVMAPTRHIRVWYGKKFILVADNDDQIRRWLCNRFPKSREDEWETYVGLFVCVDNPLTPKEYPKCGADVLQAVSSLAGARALFDEMLTAVPSQATIILGSRTSNGHCLAAVTIAPARSGRGAFNDTESRLTKGFRPGKVPRQLTVNRYVSSSSALRASVERADASWIHGRDLDPRFEQVRNSTVAIIGCGSVGGAVAYGLAQAGVGKLRLIDPDLVTWANIGRHVLGASHVGGYKAEELSGFIRQAFPHIQEVDFINRTCEELLSDVPNVLCDSDLVVSTMANWAAEGTLNEWHLSTGRSPDIVYGWLEPYASAGHAVVITNEGACLQCGFSNIGLPTFRVTEWTGISTIQHEPACGVTFQPYGPIELQCSCNLITQTALDRLLKVGGSTHRMWIAGERYLKTTGGKWTREWLETNGNASKELGCVNERQWARNATCLACAGEAI